MAIKLRQPIIYGSVTINSGSTYAEVSLPQIADINKTFILSSHIGSGTAITVDEGMVTRKLYLNSGVPTAKFTRTASTDSVTVYYQIAEFIEGVTVQHVTVTASGFSDTGANYSKTVTINSVNTSESFPLISALAFTTGISQHCRTHFTAHLASATQLTIEFDDAAAASLTGSANVIEAQIISISRANVQLLSGTVTTAETNNITISSVDTARSFVVPSWTFAGPSASGNTGTQYTAYLSSATNLVFQVYVGSNTKTYKHHVIELPPGCVVERKNIGINSGSTNNTASFSGAFNKNQTMVFNSSQYGTGCITNSTAANDFQGVLTAITNMTDAGAVTIYIGNSSTTMSTNLFAIQFPGNRNTGPSGGVAIGGLMY